jgi:hypothetical protein
MEQLRAFFTSYGELVSGELAAERELCVVVEPITRHIV